MVIQSYLAMISISQLFCCHQTLSLFSTLSKSAVVSVICCGLSVSRPRRRVGGGGGGGGGGVHILCGSAPIQPWWHHKESKRQINFYITFIQWIHSKRPTANGEAPENSSGRPMVQWKINTVGAKTLEKSYKMQFLVSCKWFSNPKFK